MRGKAGLVIGLGIGYVLGTRAGRQRYEQIKAQALKVWQLDPVQAQVDKARDFAKSSVMALPGALWVATVRIGKAAAEKGTAGQRIDAAVQASRGSADEVRLAARESADAVTDLASGD